MLLQFLLKVFLITDLVSTVLLPLLKRTRTMLGYDHNAGPPTDQLPEPVPDSSHHVVLGSSGSEVRSTDAILTSQFGLTVIEISSQSTILASALA